MDQIVSLETSQCVRTETVSGQVETIREDIADIKNQFANFQAALMNRVNRMFIDGARQRARDWKEMEKHAQRTNRLEFAKWQDYEKLRLENKELSHRCQLSLFLIS